MTTSLGGWPTKAKEAPSMVRMAQLNTNPVKVTFCRIMILCTQYYPVNVFICVSSLLVSSRFRWFYLQTSEMVLFVTITIANFAFYWVMVLHAQFLPMNFFFCVSFSCWIHLVTGGSTLFQLVPGSSNLVQVVPVSSRLFQLVPRFSIYATFDLLCWRTGQNRLLVFLYIYMQAI